MYIVTVNCVEASFEGIVISDSGHVIELLTIDGIILIPRQLVLNMHMARMLTDKEEAVYHELHIAYGTIKKANKEMVRIEKNIGREKEALRVLKTKMRMENLKATVKHLQLADLLQSYKEVKKRDYLNISQIREELTEKGYESLKQLTELKDLRIDKNGDIHFLTKGIEIEKEEEPSIKELLTMLNVDVPKIAELKRSFMAFLQNEEKDEDCQEEDVEEMTLGNATFYVERIHSDNPGVDEFLQVKGAPKDFGINGDLFLDIEEMMRTLEANGISLEEEKKVEDKKAEQSKDVQSMTFGNKTFYLEKTHSDNPEDGEFLLVKGAPPEFGINGDLFYDVGEIIHTLQSNGIK